MQYLARCLLVLGSCTAGAALAQDADESRDWPRFHIGVAVGRSQLGPDMASVGVPEQPWGNGSLDSERGTKVVVGFRPHRFVGVELQSVDFGGGAVAAHSGRQLSGGQVTYWQLNSYMEATSDAEMLSAVLFFPEPSAWLDVYAKVGVAHLHESFRAYATDYLSPGCEPRPSTTGPPYPPFCSFYTDKDRSDATLYVDQSESMPYAGIGVRFKVVRRMAVRVEYETIDREIGDNTTLLSLGFAWESSSLSRRSRGP